MRVSCKLWLALGLAVTISSLALAQRQPFPFGGFGGTTGIALLTNKSVQDELKLTKEQVEKVTQAQAKMMEKMQDIFGKLQDLKPEERREKIQSLMKEASLDAEKMLKDVLKPEQTKRLKEIEVQQAGIQNFANEEIQKTLKLTGEQKDKIKTMSDDVRKDTQEIFKEAGRDFQKMAEARKKIVSLNKEAVDKAKATLNAEQKKALDNMMGKPFDLKIEAPRFPGTGAEQAPARRDI